MMIIEQVVAAGKSKAALLKRIDQQGLFKLVEACEDFLNSLRTPHLRVSIEIGETGGHAKLEIRITDADQGNLLFHGSAYEKEATRDANSYLH